MQTSEEGLDLIKEFEGFVPHVYICAGGYPTIGYGHVVKKGESFPQEISEDMAVWLLSRDVAWAERAVLRHIGVELSQNEFDALVSFTFNLGGGALQSSTLRRRVNKGQKQRASHEFKRWVWAGGRRLKGLMRRRKAESLMFLG